MSRPGVIWHPLMKWILSSMNFSSLMRPAERYPRNGDDFRKFDSKRLPTVEGWLSPSFKTQELMDGYTRDWQNGRSCTAVDVILQQLYTAGPRPTGVSERQKIAKLRSGSLCMPSQFDSGQSTKVRIWLQAFCTLTSSHLICNIITHTKRRSQNVGTDILQLDSLEAINPRP